MTSRDIYMTSSDVTKLLQAIGAGNEAAYDELLPILYNDLHRLAQSQMRRERRDHTWQPTELVNEAFLRLVQGNRSWQNRAHFFAAASEAMRRILVDHARRRAAQKRGGEYHRITFDSLAMASSEPDVDILALNDALEALAEHDSRLEQVVKLRFFVGLNVQEVAELLEISPATVKRDWTYARAWLFERLDNATGAG